MKILIVDDSLVFQNFFKTTLSHFKEVNYIQTASNGQQAIQRAKLTEFDLILLDLEMPVMNGIETLKRLRKDKFKGKIIVCSGRTLVDYQAIQEAMYYGADGVTSKSYQKGVSSTLSPEDFRNELIPRIFQIYNTNLKERPSEIIKHAYDKECIDGILVIHLLEKNEHLLKYDYGSLEEGLDQVKNILKIASTTRTPLFIDDTMQTLPNIKKVTEGVENYPPKLFFNMATLTENCLSLDWVHTGLEAFIKNHKIANLLILGFNRTCCVKNAAEQIHKYYGINITICDQLLFSKIESSQSIENKNTQDLHKEMFKEKYILKENLDEVIHGLRKNVSIKAERFEQL